MTINNNFGREPPSPKTGALDADYGHHPIHDRAQRPLQVIVIGAGPSGIAMLIELLKIPFLTIRCFEKNPDVGGTWLETRYPGAACDVASHAYQYSFCSKTDCFAPAEEIGDYFTSVAKKYGLYNHITFHSRVTSAEWDELKAQWKVMVESDTREAAPETFVADVLINAGGILNDWAWPEIDGLQDFKGHRVHTATWDSTIDLKDKTVAVIGSGASSIQVVPSIQPVAKKVDVYVRSPTYILPTVGFGFESSTFNESYSESDMQNFSTKPAYYKQFRKRIEQQMNENFSNSSKTSTEQIEARLWAENMMKKAILSPELQKKLIPSWELGCRRLTPGLPYLNAVQQPNVNVIRDGIKRILEGGIETVNDQVIEADVIICATGFITSFSSRFNIVGRYGRTLKEMWKDRGAEAYLGTAIADRDRLTGRVTAVWPGSSIHFMEMVETPRWEDFEIQYVHSNPFRFMGNGFSQRETNGADLTYYLDQMRE
ncbi:hypothetical protein G7Z17_g3173 [Cylindrodendrum hubeiense]|uniref:Flavin-containing monooxygenase n=1 Tax=Cylindrodendrum hubeiense TaxID=595255 RepID=A0A9P5HBC5_9HYPO|nr:hypothetical protein G7Z17_g3173 [Cylindrodendrum hubeiense]